jgi:hypothetical protein
MAFDKNFDNLIIFKENTLDKLFKIQSINFLFKWIYIFDFKQK